MGNLHLGDSFIERTNGISVAWPSPAKTDDISLALIDTAGTHTPVDFNSDIFVEKSYERPVNDSSFIQEVAFSSAEIYVQGDQSAHSWWSTLFESIDRT